MRSHRTPGPLLLTATPLRLSPSQGQTQKDDRLSALRGLGTEGAIASSGRWFLQLAGACGKAGSSLREEGSWSQDRRWRQGPGMPLGRRDTGCQWKGPAEVTACWWLVPEGALSDSPEDPEAGAAARASPSAGPPDGGASTEERRGRPAWGVVCFLNSASVSLSLPGFPHCLLLSLPGFLVVEKLKSLRS